MATAVSIISGQDPTGYCRHLQTEQGDLFAAIYASQFIESRQSLFTFRIVIDEILLALNDPELFVNMVVSVLDQGQELNVKHFWFKPEVQVRGYSIWVLTIEFESPIVQEDANNLIEGLVSLTLAVRKMLLFWQQAGLVH